MSQRGCAAGPTCPPGRVDHPAERNATRSAGIIGEGHVVPLPPQAAVPGQGPSRRFSVVQVDTEDAWPYMSIVTLLRCPDTRQR